ncbi:MAG TPA: YceI family protein [Terriglobales bacterium]
MSRSLLGFVAAVLLTSSAAFAQNTWQLDPPHSAAQFAVKHFGISTVRGTFTKVSGTVTYDDANPTKATVQATIDAASVDTRVENRDKDLRGPNYFDVEKFPTITFQSKKVEVAGEGKLKVTGDLTMHGVTKEVILEVDGPSAVMKDMHGNMRRGASATTKINRHDFGVNGGAAAVGDDVTITLDVEMTQAGK